MRRRSFLVILCLFMLFSCITVAQAENAASTVQSYSTVDVNGNCLVSLNITIRLDQAVDDLYFPLPADASDVRLNGSSVFTSSSSAATYVDLGDFTSGMVGSFPVTISYTQPNAVQNQEGNLVLVLPLLSGFPFPVETMSFAVTMPADVTGNPKFSSTYHPSTMNSYLEYAVNGKMISGNITAPLEDHESLTMTLDVPEEMFPSISTYHRSGNPELIPMAICLALALLYWLLFLRTAPFISVPGKMAPEGVGAGELGCRLTFSGADLTMMVFSWAQLGYITLQLDDRGRVYLHKRMDIGNERSLFEIRVFRSLFGEAQVVNATSYNFAKLARKARAMVPGERALCQSSSGNIKFFRILASATGAFCGILFAMNISSYTVLQVLLSIGLGLLGVLTAWNVQNILFHIHLSRRMPIVIGILAAAVWLLIGLFCGQILIVLIYVAVHLLVGFAAAYGGRRSDMGRQQMKQILGLRKYLKHMNKEEVQRTWANDPEFFYNMAPYAMALGVGKRFARSFGKRPVPPCPYLIVNLRERLYAEDWMLIMEETAKAMNAHLRRMDLERWAVIRIR